MSNTEKGAPVDNLQPLSQPAHSLSYEDAIKQLGTNSDDGLTSAEVKQRLDNYGENMLEGDEGVSLAKIVIRQIANAMMLVSQQMKHISRRVWLLMRTIIGSHHSHGRQFWYSIMDRRRLHRSCHWVEYRGWSLPRLRRRENHGLFAIPQFPNRCGVS